MRDKPCGRPRFGFWLFFSAVTGFVNTELTQTKPRCDFKLQLLANKPVTKPDQPVKKNLTKQKTTPTLPSDIKLAKNEVKTRWRSIKGGGNNEQGGKKEVGSEGKREHRGEIVAQTRSWMNTRRLCAGAVCACVRNTGVRSEHLL